MNNIFLFAIPGLEFFKFTLPIEMSSLELNGSVKLLLSGWAGAGGGKGEKNREESASDVQILAY